MSGDRLDGRVAMLLLFSRRRVTSARFHLDSASFIAISLSFSTLATEFLYVFCDERSSFNAKMEIFGLAELRKYRGNMVALNDNLSNNNYDIVTLTYCKIWVACGYIKTTFHI